MPYSDEYEYAALGGAPGYDLLGQTPGITGPLDMGKNTMASAESDLAARQKAMRESPLGRIIYGFGKGVEAANPLSEPVNSANEVIKSATTGDFWTTLFSRGIYLVVGVIFLVIGLVMLSSSAKQGVIMGVSDALEQRG